MEEIEERILAIFFDSSKRPKSTPRHESAIMVMLEDDYSPGKVRTGLKKLENSGKLVSMKKGIEKVGEAKFYYLKQYDDFVLKQKTQKRVNNAAKWITKYSNKKVTKMVGDHLHDVVKAELRAQGFEIRGEKTKKYQGKEWPKTNETLDIIAKHRTRNLTVGIEIKNMLYLVPISEIISKIEICNYLGIKPVFACRWLEPHRNELVKRGGFLWQFKKQLYPRGQENLVEALRKRFKFPVEVSSELPPVSIKEFKSWMKIF